MAGAPRALWPCQGSGQWSRVTLPPPLGSQSSAAAAPSPRHGRKVLGPVWSWGRAEPGLYQREQLPSITSVFPLFPIPTIPPPTRSLSRYLGLLPPQGCTTGCVTMSQPYSSAILPRSEPLLTKGQLLTSTNLPSQGTGDAHGGRRAGQSLWESCHALEEEKDGKAPVLLIAAALLINCCSGFMPRFAPALTQRPRQRAGGS